MIQLMLEAIPLPKHRPMEIQSSDRGEGVGSNERLVQIRMAETFQIYNLDLQARVHYAPNDSPSHIAEKVMRSLNEHAGDGRTINIPEVELTELEDIGVLLNMSKTELEILKENQQELASKRCAELVARKYQGKPSMGTSIHARTPNLDSPYETFFFDYDLMEKCHVAYNCSDTRLDTCAGSFYFRYQMKFFNDHYLLYDGAVEGIRNGCHNSGTQCEFHSKFDNPALLLNGWSGLSMQRVHPPVPDYNLSNALGEFHYCMPDQVKNHTFQEKFSLTKEKVPVNAEERER